MKTRYAPILALTIGLLLIGCATSDEGTRNQRHVDRLMRHHDWPLIQQITKKEVNHRETSWPEGADYVPSEHKDNIWTIAAMTGTPNGDVERTVILTIGHDGKVLAYKRYWKQQPVEVFPDTP
jgi:hypothetical protein